MTGRRLLAGAVALVLVAGVIAVVRHQAGPGDADAQQARLQVDGAATVVDLDGGERHVEDAAEAVVLGEQITMVSGSAVLELADGATYELRARERTASTVEVAPVPRLLAGDLLVTDGFPAAVAVDTATLSAQGALRVDADEAVASAYEGRTRVTGVGDVDELPGLRRLVLVAGAAPEPIAYDGADEWDRRYLGEAIAFGERLEALARGYTSDLAPGEGRSMAFFRSVLPALADERELGDDLLDPSRSPGETLVGAAIVVQGRRSTARERWAEVFEFRDAGAAWGLVARDQGVSSAPVLDAIELAIGTASSAAGTPARTDAPPTTSSGGRATTTTNTTTSTTTTTAPPPPPSGGGLLDPVVGPSSEILGDLLEVLGLAPG